MSNFPPGMTRADWQHIDGEQHNPLCPEHEDYEHKCMKEMPFTVCPGWRGRRGYWELRVHTTTIEIEFCPFCGEDLGSTDCICKELAEDREEA